MIDQDACVQPIEYFIRVIKCSIVHGGEHSDCLIDNYAADINESLPCFLCILVFCLEMFTVSCIGTCRYVWVGWSDVWWGFVCCPILLKEDSMVLALLSDLFLVTYRWGLFYNR